MSDLCKVPFLANLGSADLETLARCMEKRTYDAGDLIYADGTPGEGLYYVEAGTVAVLTSASCDGEMMAHLPAGSTFGDAALLNDHPRTSAVRSATDSTIMVLPRSTFQTFLTEHPAAGQIVTQTLMQRPARGARQLVAELLKPMPLFSNVSDEDMLEIARKLRLTQLCDNSLVFAEGQAPDALYLVETGAVSLLGNESTGSGVVAEIKRHDFFGEDALLTDQPREFSAMSNGSVDLWAFTRADFDAMANAHPAAVLALTRSLAARSEKLNRQLLAMTSVARMTAAPVTAVAAASPVRMATPVRPAVQRQPLLAGLRTWLAGLSLSGRVRLAVISLLVAWLLAVSLPSVIAGGLSGTSQANTTDVRSVTVVEPSSRGLSAVRGPEADLIVNSIDSADAPLARMSDLVTLKAAAPLPTATSAPAAVALAAPAAASPAPAVVKAASYTVASGDTLSEIAARFNVDATVLAEANDISNPALIRVDQVLAIPGGDEQVQIAAKLAAAPRPTATPVPAAPAVAMAAAPAAAPAASDKPALPFTWDGRLDKWGIHMDAASVADGQPYYRLVKALFRDTNEAVGPNLPGGDHNIYVEVLDENGKRLLGAKAIVQNGGQTVLIMENKPFPEYAANFPMYGMMGSYATYVDGLPSDKVVGMGLPMKWHVTYFLTFQRTTK